MKIIYVNCGVKNYLKVIAVHDIVGLHVTSLKFKLLTIEPTAILLSRCIRAATYGIDLELDK